MQNNHLRRLFTTDKPIIGMVHVKPLPGSPRASRTMGRLDLDAVYNDAVLQAESMIAGGVDGLLLENAGDIPFQKPDRVGPETAAFMSVVGERVRNITDLPMGFNIVANAAMVSLACARASGAQFIRVNQWANAYVANEGFVEGAAAEAMRFRCLIDAENIMVMADVHVKHGSHAIVSDRPIEEQARDTAFFGAEILIATGFRTGHATSIEEIEQVRSGSGCPVLVGSGLTAENASAILPAADGAIVGVSVKEPHMMGGAVIVERVKELVDEARKVRSSTVDPEHQLAPDG